MSNFSDVKLEQIWNNAKIPNEQIKTEWRKDYAGAWICRTKYGVESDYGWEVDHAKPVSKGGGDELNNLVPLHWKNNRTKGDNYPSFKTSVSSDGNKNIEKEQSWNYNK